MDKLTARKLLGVEVNADIREIKKAYARKVKEVHPEEDPEGFKQINEAYEFLKQTSTQIHHNTFEEEVFTKKESIESTNHFDYIHEEKTENEFIEANTDFDSLLDKENKRQENYEKAILELREYFTNPTTKLVDYKIFYNNPDYQDFIYHDEFIEELVGLLKNIQLSPEMNQFFYQTYHLNKSNTSSKENLKKLFLLNQ